MSIQKARLCHSNHQNWDPASGFNILGTQTNQSHYRVSVTASGGMMAGVPGGGMSGPPQEIMFPGNRVWCLTNTAITTTH